jgi:hypothetical protein
MKAFIFAGLVGLFGLVGCASPKYAIFVDSVEAYAEIIVPEWKQYIDKDPSLDAESKERIKKTGDELLELIERAKANK